MVVLKEFTIEDRCLKIQLREGELYFAHLTYSDNLDSIKKEGLKLSGDVSMFPTECLYCVDIADYHGMDALRELSEDMTHDHDDEMLLVLGNYKGEYYEVAGCTDEEEENSYAIAYIGLLDKEAIKIDKFMAMNARDTQEVIENCHYTDIRETDLAHISGCGKIKTIYY